ncbi:dnaJ homolog subfamily B member 14-like [Drosophila guanche]|uniref:dnaJ homolog subfamily B member 14-like n=1 Tax=Drosophila guanche TaxID=7266 RepID=UPI001470EFD8|nr:dnaJ homolog subfamily B member 14-like [Drosophila guanche]
MDEQVEGVRRINACRNNYYAVLNVPQAATDGQINRAFRQLSRVVHPDKNKRPGATDAFQAIARAKCVLLDPTKRHHFDQQLRQAIAANIRGQGRANAQRSSIKINIKINQRSKFAVGYQFCYENAVAIIVLIIVLIVSIFIFKMPTYSLESTSKFSVKCLTTNKKTPYFVGRHLPCFSRYSAIGKKWEHDIEKKFLSLPTDKCNLEAKLIRKQFGVSFLNSPSKAP